MEEETPQETWDYEPAAAPLFLSGRAGGVGVVLVHGLTAAPTEVKPVAAFLHDREPSFTLSCPLLPGHGRSPAVLARTEPRSWLQVVNAEVDRLNTRCRTVSVVGVSMGAMLAAAVALAGKSVGSIVMLAPVFALSPGKALYVRLLRGIVPYAKKSRRSLENHRAKRLFSYDRYPLVSLHHLHVFGTGIRRRLGELRIPVLVACGRRDPYVDFSSTKSLCASLGPPEAEFVDCPDSGHVLPHEPDAAMLFDRMLRFLRRVHGIPGFARRSVTTVKK